MAKKRQSRSPTLGMDTNTERLDELNAQMRLKGSTSKVIRRSIEAQIESKAKRRRSQEAAASSAFKR